jgi:hypothetical protein
MASIYSMKLTNASMDGITGHHRVDAQIFEQAGDTTIPGVRETYGIDLAALNSQFGGDTAKWQAWIGQEMLQKHMNRMNVHKEIAGWEGLEIPLTLPS